MVGFEDRKKAHEAKFAHDQALTFRATARRNKLLGLWAAGKMGLSGDAAAAYATEVVKSDVEEAGDHDVMRKVKGDLDARNADISEHRIRREMDELMKIATDQIRSEAGP